MVMMALFGFRDAVGKRVEISPGGEDEMDAFWWTKGTLREELRPWVNALTKDPPEFEYKENDYGDVMNNCRSFVILALT